MTIGAAIGATLVWATLPRTTPSACGSPTNGNTPLGSSPGAFGVIDEATLGNDYWYNFSSQSAGGSLLLDSLSFQVQSSTGSNVTPGASWTLTAFDPSGGRLGTYALTGSTAGTWTSGGSHPFTSGQLFSLLATPDRLSGDSLLIRIAGFGPCTSSGSTNLAVP